jgi:cell wall-associated NlpC family hydrolase
MNQTPPVGALVFYGGGGGDGHVAVSIGNGQEVGTLGMPGGNALVSQYSVIGSLNNQYLGWAVPFGS